MKRMLVSWFSVLAAVTTQAQTPEPFLVPPPLQISYTQVQQSSAEQRGPAAGRGTNAFRSLIAYGTYTIGGETRYGPAVIAQYSLNRNALPAIDLSFGTMFRLSNSFIHDERQYVPVATLFASRYPYHSSPFYTDEYATHPRLSAGLIFFGTDLTFYVLQGTVRPYVGIGGQFLLYPHARRLNATIAPHAKGGVEVRIKSGFAGFAEVRHAVGVPTLIGSNTSKFGGLTAGAVGVSFAPRL